MQETVTKGEFAEIAGVSAGRVSQWIAEGKIRAGSLDGEGRKARVIVASALKDLNRTLDVSQRIGLNGLKSSVAREGLMDGEDQQQAGSDLPRPDGAGSDRLLRSNEVADQIAQEKLRQAQIQTRQKEREEALETGRYMLADDARMAIGQTASKMLNAVEGGLQGMADLFSSEHGLVREEALHTLIKGFRHLREKLAEGFREEAQALAMVQRDMEEDDGTGDVS